MMIYVRLFYEFFKTGLFAIGGGMATLPFLHDIGETTGWYTQTQLMNMLAVSESTPGPIGINMAPMWDTRWGYSRSHYCHHRRGDAFHHRHFDRGHDAEEVSGQQVRQ